MTPGIMSPMGAALIAEADERDWRVRIRRIANRNYRGVRPTRTSLWWQLCEVALESRGTW